MKKEKRKQQSSIYKYIHISIIILINILFISFYFISIARNGHICQSIAILTICFHHKLIGIHYHSLCPTICCTYFLIIIPFDHSLIISYFRHRNPIFLILISFTLIHGTFWFSLYILFIAATIPSINSLNISNTRSMLEIVIISSDIFI